MLEERKSMITITLDEYGEFEKEGHEPLFVAGLIYDDKDIPGEKRAERERIGAYYKMVIKDAGEGFSYPQDLHSNGDKKRDHEIIRPVKNKVSETFSEFITEGTYVGKALCNEAGNRLCERKGKYHLFVMLKSDEGKKKLLAANANMLANDNWASNRYFHMAGAVVNRIIFHNPIYKKGEIPSVSIDIATRATQNIANMNLDRIKEYTKQGYRVNESEDNNYQYYSIMNADIYRTLIAQEMVNSKNVTIKIDEFRVSSIQYHPETKMKEFLYLADSLCSILEYKLTGSSADDWLGQIVDRTSSINSKSENLVFGYDEIDNYFSEAWEYYEKGKLFEAFSVAYDAKVKKGEFAEHYREVWFPYLEKRIRETITPELFAKSVNALSELLTINNLNQEKLLYIMKQFEQMVEYVSGRYRSIDAKSRDLYKLYDIGLSAFCHIGNAGKALEYYEKCKEYAFYVGVDAFLKTNNKLIVCLEDSFEWDKALEIATQNVDYQQLASEMKREILSMGNETDFLDEARAISQLARIYALQRDEKAEKFFREALAKLKKGSANYKITQSYLLHYYADRNMQKEFDEEALDYFDRKSTYNQKLRYIMNTDGGSHSTFSTQYALYVLVRGLYCFHQEEIDDVFWEKLCDLDQLVSKKEKREPGGHPWEITYKYLEMLAIRRNDEGAREKFFKRRKECLKDKGEIIVALEQYGDAEVENLANNFVERDKITSSLADYLKQNFSSLKDCKFATDGDDRYREMRRIFTFMYR